jgi:hypothetical protein
MAYDSATAVAEASNAYKRALAVAQQKRASIEQGYGLNDDGTMDNTEAGHLGSIYQGNLDSVNQEHQAEVADRRRGFGIGGGLAGKNTAAADRVAQQRQALGLRSAAADLGANTQEQQLATQDYRDQVGDDGLGGIIGRNAAWDLAQNLIATPVLGSAPAPASPLGAAISPVQAAANRLALKKNPRAAQAAKNNRY